MASSTMDFYKIHLPFWSLQSQEETESHRDRDQLWGCPLSAPLLAVEPSAHTSKQPGVASQSCPLAIQQKLVPASPFCSGVPEPLSARTPPCQLQAPASALPFRSGPCSRVEQPHGEEAESTFWADFLLSAAGQSSQETREWATGDGGFFISSAGNSGFICPRPF